MYFMPHLVHALHLSPQYANEVNVNILRASANPGKHLSKICNIRREARLSQLVATASFGGSVRQGIAFLSVTTAKRVQMENAEMACAGWRPYNVTWS
jgi:hypothetical protein